MWVVFWLGFSVLVGVVAAGRGRSGVGWFALSLVISPLIGLLLVAVLGNLKEQAARAASEPGSKTHVRCPKCAEWVLPEATVCKHCGAALVPDHAFQSRRLLADKQARAGDARDYAYGVAGLAVLIGLVALLSRCTD